MRTNRMRLIGLCCLMMLSLCSIAAEKEHVFTVAIDAGHGGKDPGAVGKISKEKDLNLAIALSVGKKIQDMYPEVKVVYTRQTDEFISLQGRANIVNKNNADLFICIHTNSSDNRSAHGAETFVLGTEKMEQNLDVAMRENAVIQLESDYQTQYQGFDPNSIDSYIMFELMQNAYMDQSLKYATLIQQQFVSKLHREDRGVRQAAFWVLLKSACPSVLVEIGFISNPEEERYLASAQGQEELAQSIYNAFTSFYKRPQKPEVPVESAAPATPAVEEPKVAGRKEGKKEKQEIKKEEKQELEQAAKPETLYAIQIFAMRDPVKENDPVLKKLPAQYVVRGGWCKYIAAISADKESTRAQLAKMREMFPDCFVIEVQSNEIIGAQQ